MIAGALSTDNRPPPPVDECDWSETCVGPVLNGLKNPANLNTCERPSEWVDTEHGRVPQQFIHPVTGERVGARIVR
jgi:hypothetical protein